MREAEQSSRAPGTAELDAEQEQAEEAFKRAREMQSQGEMEAANTLFGPGG